MGKAKIEPSRRNLYKTSIKMDKSQNRHRSSHHNNNNFYDESSRPSSTKNYSRTITDAGDLQRQLNKRLGVLMPEKFASLLLQQKQQHEKATNLRDRDAEKEKSEEGIVENKDSWYGACPAFETYLDISERKLKEKFFKDIRAGDAVCGEIRSVEEVGISVRLLCVDSDSMQRDLEDLRLDVFVPRHELILSKPGEDPYSIYYKHKLVRVVVTDVNVDKHHLAVALQSAAAAAAQNKRLGIISESDLPAYFRADTKTTYEDNLRNSPGFRNPNSVDTLCRHFGIPAHQMHTFSSNLRSNSSKDCETARELRKMQSRRLAMKSVVKGVDRLRNNQQTEAIQHFNRALEIDPDNVEGLVGRGALYANSDSYDFAIRDFEQALSIDRSHVNARRYLMETLLAQGKMFEKSTKRRRSEKNKAQACYEKILQLHANNKEAINRLRKLNPTKMVGKRRLDSDSSEETVNLSSDREASPARKKKRISKDSHAADDDHPPPSLSPSSAARLKDHYQRLSAQTDVADGGGGDPVLFSKLKQYYDYYSNAMRKKQHRRSSAKSSDRGNRRRRSAKAASTDDDESPSRSSSKNTSKSSGESSSSSDKSGTGSNSSSSSDEDSSSSSSSKSGSSSPASVVVVPSDDKLAKRSRRREKNSPIDRIPASAILEDDAHDDEKREQQRPVVTVKIPPPPKPTGANKEKQSSSDIFESVRRRMDESVDLDVSSRGRRSEANAKKDEREENAEIGSNKATKAHRGEESGGGGSFRDKKSTKEPKNNKREEEEEKRRRSRDDKHRTRSSPERGRGRTESTRHSNQQDNGPRERKRSRGPPSPKYQSHHHKPAEAAVTTNGKDTEQAERRTFDRRTSAWKGPQTRPPWPKPDRSAERSKPPAAAAKEAKPPEDIKLIKQLSDMEKFIAGLKQKKGS